MKKLIVCILTGLLMATPLLGVAGSSGGGPGEPPPIAGIMGMTPVTASSCYAIWVPITDGQALSGINFFNNDELTVYPEILLESGTAQYPVSLADCTIVAQNIFGGSLQWSEVPFDFPVTCQSEGLYVLIRLPEGGEQEAEGIGGGPGIGFVENGGLEGWLSADGHEWVRVSQAYGFAVQPLFVDSDGGMVQMNGGQRGDLQGRSFRAETPETGLVGISPNPFNPATDIHFVLRESSHVRVSVFDVRGRKVVDLADGVFEQGRHQLTWQGQNQNGNRVSSGVYFARLQVKGTNYTCRMLLVK